MLMWGLVPITTAFATLRVAHRWGSKPPVVVSAKTNTEKAPLPRIVGSEMALEYVAPILVDQCIADKLGDQLTADPKAVIDIVSLCIGSDGRTTRLELTFSGKSTLDQLGGYVFIDLDQDASTGYKPSMSAGLPSQDLGMGVDATVSLFEITENPGFPYVAVHGQHGTYYMSAQVVGQTIVIDLDLDLLADDGNMSVSLVVGDKEGPTDWAPETGSLYLFVAGGKFFPETTRFLVGQNWDLVTIVRSGVSDIYRVRTFLNDRPYEIVGRSSTDFPPSRSVLVYRLFNFGANLKPGIYKLDVAVYTDRGVFGDTAIIQVVAQPK